jgi:hypothetical protein
MCRGALLWHCRCPRWKTGHRDFRQLVRLVSHGHKGKQRVENDGVEVSLESDVVW